MEKEIAEIRDLAERNYELIVKNTKNINENFKKINQNKYALDILGDYKTDARRWFIAFIIVSILLVVSLIIK